MRAAHWPSPAKSDFPLQGVLKMPPFRCPGDSARFCELAYYKRFVSLQAAKISNAKAQRCKAEETQKHRNAFTFGIKIDTT
jgi:hypothetical protein